MQNRISCFSPFDFKCEMWAGHSWDSPTNISQILTEAPTDILIFSRVIRSGLITAVILHEGRCRVTRNGFTESARKSRRILRDISAICFCAFPHWWTPPPERMNQWNFGISMTSLMSKLISVFVGCQVLRSRLQKFGLRMSSYMWQKHRGTSIGGDIREVTRPRFHDHHLCTFFFSYFVGGEK